MKEPAEKSKQIGLIINIPVQYAKDVINHKMVSTVSL